MKHPIRPQGTLPLTILVLLLFVGWQGVSLGQPADTWMANTLINSVIGAGGITDPAAASGYSLQGTIGQSTPIGIAAVPGVYMLDAGFWHKYGRYNIVDVDHEPAIPQITAIYQNWPNPFHHSTTILFSLAQASLVDLSVYDVSGRKVQTLAQGPRDAGWHQIHWDARDFGGRRLSTGVYFYKLKTDTHESTRQMLLSK